MAGDKPGVVSVRGARPFVGPAASTSDAAPLSEAMTAQAAALTAAVEEASGAATGALVASQAHEAVVQRVGHRWRVGAATAYRLLELDLAARLGALASAGGLRLGATGEMAGLGALCSLAADGTLRLSGDFTTSPKLAPWALRRALYAAELYVPAPWSPWGVMALNQALADADAFVQAMAEYAGESLPAVRIEQARRAYYPAGGPEAHTLATLEVLCPRLAELRVVDPAVAPADGRVPGIETVLVRRVSGDATTLAGASSYDLLVLRCPGDHAALWERPDFWAAVLPALQTGGHLANMLTFKARPVLGVLSPEVLGLQRLAVCEARHTFLKDRGGVEILRKNEEVAAQHVRSIVEIDRALSELLKLAGVGQGALRFTVPDTAVEGDAVSRTAALGGVVDGIGTALVARLAVLPEAIGERLRRDIGGMPAISDPLRGLGVGSPDAPAIRPGRLGASPWPTREVLPPVASTAPGFPESRARVDSWVADIERGEMTISEAGFHAALPRLGEHLSADEIDSLSQRLAPCFDDRTRALDEPELIPSLTLE